MLLVNISSSLTFSILEMSKEDAAVIVASDVFLLLAAVGRPNKEARCDSCHERVSTQR